MKKLSILGLAITTLITGCTTTNSPIASKAPTQTATQQQIHTRYATVPTQYITADNGVRYAYRRMGKPQAVPIIYFNHLASNMDNCDPRIVDALAQDFEIICFDYKGVGGTSGKDAKSIQEMAHDSLAFIRALGYEKIDVLSFSMGGFISQEIMAIKPDLIRKIILAGTGGRGGQGVSDVVGLTYNAFPMLNYIFMKIQGMGRFSNFMKILYSVPKPFLQTLPKTITLDMKYLIP